MFVRVASRRSLTHCPDLACTRPSSTVVLPGGRLDTRFLIMVRGGGRYLDAGKTMRLNFGTHVRVQVGGDYTATG